MLTTSMKTLCDSSMATFGGSFESETSIEDRKEHRRKARQDVVEKAKQSYEREEQKRELKRLRGEDTWMLPELSQRLQTTEQDDSSKSKKKKEKKSKKAKKEKKKKEKRRAKVAGSRDGCSDSSEASEEEWVEAQPQAGPAKAWQIPAERSHSPTQESQRDEWMTFDFLAMKTTSTTERRAEKDRLKEEEKAKAQAIEQAGLHKLELNPFWKDGGSGLPPGEEPAATAQAKRGAAVNDGGLSWLKKSYQRMREQADRDNCNLNDIVAQRYGSMEEFQKRLAEAEEAAYGTQRRGGGGALGRGRGWRRGQGDSWRAGGRDGPGAEGQRDPSPPDQGRRWERRGQARDQGRQRERSPEGERHREGQRSGDQDRGGRGGDGEDQRERGSDRRRGGDREGDWGRHGEREGDRGRHGERDGDRWRQGDREGDRGRHGDREGDRGRHGDREGDRGRQGDREGDRGREGDREGDRGREGDREGDRGRQGDREGDRGRSSPADRPQQERRYARGEEPSPGLSPHRRPPAAGSLKGRFLKPSEDEDVVGEPRSAPAPAGLSKAFLKPSSDDEDPPTTARPRQNPGGPNAMKKGSDRPAEQQRGDKEIPDITAQPGNEATVSSSSEEDEEEDLPLLTDEEMNKLGARLVKAEIMGNAALLDKLKSQMESARKAKEIHETRQQQAAAVKANQPPGGSEADQELLLFRTDHSGRAWPVNAPSGPQEPHGGRRKSKPIETHVDGERVRYFQGDDAMGLQEMVRREKMSTPQDQNALYARMAGKMMGKADGDNYTLDDMFVSSAAQREGEGRDEARMRSQAAAEGRQLAACMERCPRCFSSQELQKHLIVAIGAKVYLSLPAGVSMAEGHCLIAPLQHHCSATGLDEDVWAEMQLFRRSLVRMFESQEMDCVFMETHMSPRRRQHMVLECVPLPPELGDMAPIYFKKAIMECDEEWAMNKKVVSLSSKNIRQAVPRGLPYFAVDFGLQGGFAHVIEDEQKFPHYFGKEVVGGMMDLEPRRWRKPIRENFDDQRKKVLQFAQWWKPNDCTKTDG